MLRLPLAALIIALAGCANIQPYKSAAVSEIAKFNDQVQADSEYVFCHGYTVGAWVRRFGNDPTSAAAWRQLCLRGATEAPAQ